MPSFLACENQALYTLFSQDLALQGPHLGVSVKVTYNSKNLQIPYRQPRGPVK